MSDPKPLGPAELNSGDLAGRVTALESVVHSWVEVCRQLRENRAPPEIGNLAANVFELEEDVERLSEAVAVLLRAKNQARLRRIKRHRYPKPKGKLTR